MRRGRIFFYLAFILILGVVAVAVVYVRFLRPAPALVDGTTPPPQETVQTTDVVFLTQRVPRGNLIDETVVELKTMQQDLVVQGMFTSIDEAVGRQAKFDLDAGIPLTAGMLVNQGEQLSTTGSNAALSIPRGMVAVSIPIDRLSSVSYAPQPGDHVNVIVSMLFVDLDLDFQSVLPNTTGLVLGPGPTTEEGGPTQLTAQVTGGGSVQGRTEIDPVLGQTLYILPTETQRPRMASQTLLQDAVVLQMGEFPLATEEETPQATEEPAPAEEGEEAAPPPPPIPEVVTLIVSPQDAVTLNYLMFYSDRGDGRGAAKLTLALRASGDDSRVQTEAVTLQFLLDQYRIPIPAKLPYGLEPRINDLVFPGSTTQPVAP